MENAKVEHRNMFMGEGCNSARQESVKSHEKSNNRDLAKQIT